MQAIHGMATATDARIFKRLREQQRQIELQQQDLILCLIISTYRLTQQPLKEIDQIRFEKEILPSTQWLCSVCDWFHMQSFWQARNFQGKRRQSDCARFREEMP